ncbi:MAG: RNA polymerase factor sigma-54, partial [Candidatus Aureabacteria bacterium]|nr:RNA polymerase factor sigma-54 [Candidatus Auribacterota bacterium]
MVIGTRMEQSMKTIQQMVLSPQMQQAIQVLQMPIMELRAKISQEMAENPILEETMSVDLSLDKNLSEMEKEPSSSPEDFNSEEFKDRFERLSNMDDEWRDFFKQSYALRRYNTLDEEKRRFLESSISVSETLHEHLLKQLELLDLEQMEYKIGEYIIGNIDTNGYLSLPTDQMALALSCDEEQIERVLTKIQQFNPPGVGARDLKECIFLQLNLSQNDAPLVRLLIENHLEDLAKHRYPQIAKRFKVPPEEVEKAAKYISTLEPKPGRNFSQEHVVYIIPDIFIEEKDGEFEININDGRIPHLRISNLYRSLMNNDETQEETKTYIKNKVQSGLWLIKNIQQRQHTILRIMKEIVQIQKRFLREGVGFLEPLTMQDIASRLNIHESTVSRAISKKYVQTPQGIFPVKYFFSQEIKTVSGESTSTRNIKQRIQDIIKAEDPKNPLSDQDIIILLEREG